jgi:hypothetical protein
MDQVSRALLMAGGAAEGTDSQFNYVTMLLPGNGTNGAQNNTFLDSSTNNFSITRNGNTTQGTFAPYGANWSNYFDGTGDYLTTPSNAAFGFGTGDYTIECWFNLQNQTVGTSTVLSIPDGAGDALLAYVNTKLYVYSPGLATFDTGVSVTNTWTHVAITRSSGTLRVFVNGALTNSASDSKSWPTTSVSIGAQSPAASFAIGYISNVRILKGTALYTAAFTPPTAPLTAITNTSLLTCQSNRFIDNSANNFTITRNGDVSVQVFSPFSPTASYAAGTNGGSGYFDGTGDYLTVPSNAALAVGSTFTVECWVYRTVGSTIQWLAGNNAGSGNTNWLLEIEANNTVYGGGWSSGTQTVSTVPVAAWTHIAMVCDSGSLKIYINGIQSGTAGSGSNFTASDITYIGQYSGASRNLPGYISNLRVLKGTALYTANFTPPTAPLTAISNTQLLLNFTNAGVIDNAMMNNLETVGNAQISTTQSKWGGSAIAFDGTGDGLTLPANVNLAVGAGDFTLEMWVYGANNGSPVGGSYPRLFTLGTAQTLGCFECYNAAGTMYIEMNNGATITFTASTLLNSTWNHYAIARSGSSVRAFVNGTQVGSTVTNSVNLNLAATTQSWIGALSASAGNFNGYINDLRITKGFARYTANFTAPTAPFPLK